MKEFQETSVVKKFFMYTGMSVSVIILFVALMFAIGAVKKVYSVWAQEKVGEARLAEATQSRKIQIEQARGEKEASKLRAEAIKIVGEAAKKYPEYRTQEFIGAFGEALRDGKIEQIMYIPTEANIPITEAARLNKKD